jgi:hypothetical protein
MKSKSKTSRVSDRYGMIEPLEARIAPAALLDAPVFRTATAGGSLLLKAGEVLTTGSGSGGSYLLYVQAGQVLVHTTDLNGNDSVDFNEITGLSVGAGARFISFVDIHGDIVTDLNPDGTLSDSGKGDIVLDNNIASITLRSPSATDFTATANQTSTQLALDHLAVSSYSIFGNIYAGGGLGIANDSTSGLLIDPSGAALQTQDFLPTSSITGNAPTIGSIYVGTAVSGHAFTFGSTGSFTLNSTGNQQDIHGNLLAFVPASGENGASVYNVRAAAAAEPFDINTIQAGNGGFNGAGGNLVNIALQGDDSGSYKLIAGNAGTGTTGQNGGSIVNFSESGAIVSEVLLQSGNGGTGLVGAGGNGGNISFNQASPIKINAHFQTVLGNGGDGYTKGGNGGGISTQQFVTPEGKVTTPLDLVSTTHGIGTIGRTQSFDFNGDGFSDVVFSTTNPDQVVVAFGNQSSGLFGLDDSTNKLNSDPTQYIFLNAPAHVTNIVVGDFNGDGHPDIAVASGNSSFAGIEVFLSQYNPQTHAFIGFSDPLFTPLPTLDGFGAQTVTNLVSGDFSGDGIVGLAATVTYPAPLGTVLLFLNGEADSLHPGGTGWFWANTAKTTLATVPYTLFPGFGAGSTLYATALKQFPPKAPGVLPGAGHDVVIGTSVGSTFASIASDAGGQTPGGAAINSSAVSYGSVDTNEQIGEEAFVPLNSLSLTITQDSVTPANADIVVLSSNPADFLAVLQGNGTGGFGIASGTGDNAGLFFGGSETPKAIVATSTVVGGNLIYSNAAVLEYGSPDNLILNFAINDTSFGPFGDASTWVTITPAAGTGTEVAFDSYVPHPVALPTVANSGPGAFGFLTGNPLQTFPPDDQAIAISQPNPGLPFTEAAFKTAGYYFTAGNGGNSQSGTGGAGGSFGNTLTITGTGLNVTGTGSLSFLYPADPTFEGTTILTAGNGGNGFNNAGNGGNLVGISMTYSTSVTTLTGDATLTAGHGGQSLTGAGGTGGSLGQLFIISGSSFTAGAGGIGTIGGSGGSILGNTTPDLLTVEVSNVNPTIMATAGTGAIGITGGGNGGRITNFANEFPGGTLLNYMAGNGGDAVSGSGGQGGSLVNDTPSSLLNDFFGDIFLRAGNGGNGLHGGTGGAITSFQELATTSDVPTSFTLLSGFGGNGTQGGGGAGGNISNIAVDGVGTSVFLTTPVNYNRVIAGAGGSSAGAGGGAGGSLATINTASVATVGVDVAAAGAGGSGLTFGGAGGTDISIVMDAGSSLGTGKILLIAGDGGASFSAKPASNTPQGIAAAIGGVNGPGGTGGGITGFTQPTNVNADVDIIAGNGGATINHGVAAGNATTDNSGQGGSVTNVTVAGSIGNIDPTVAIKSYNNILTGVAGVNKTIQDFVDNTLLNLAAPAITDATGNVGLIAGAAGRVAGTTPGSLVSSANGINGSVTNVHASNIMSMIAGNVDQVDLIQKLTDYGVTVAGGIVGAFKAVADPAFNVTIPASHITPGNPLYQAPLYISSIDALVNNPLPAGGELIDGAILAKNQRTLLSIRDFEGTN